MLSVSGYATPPLQCFTCNTHHSVSPTDAFVDSVEVHHRVKLHLDCSPRSLLADLNLGPERLPKGVLGRQDRRLVCCGASLPAAGLFQSSDQRFGGTHGQAPADRLIAHPDLVGPPLQPQQGSGVPFRQGAFNQIGLDLLWELE